MPITIKVYATRLGKVVGRYSALALALSEQIAFLALDQTNCICQSNILSDVGCNCLVKTLQEGDYITVGEQFTIFFFIQCIAASLNILETSLLKSRLFFLFVFSMLSSSFVCLQFQND